ncbi:hypothetical protein [Nocardiopsis ganjiahuensis]|uniref:hypothetical protein n=1 Tax=Nocardiopsis ganjiahuensis TaxID=239984 RepID=UPI001EF9ED90|nr:hypothetical protein [Nocardiopsis ganjiahuensis]
MKFVVLYKEEDGRWVRFLDPNPYLSILPEISADLPPGAREYATSPDHYDFYGRRCVKDLELEGVNLSPAEGGALNISVRFKGNAFKHDSGMVVEYCSVSKFEVESTEDFSRGEYPPSGLGSVKLDEVLPDSGGCSHEIVFTGGSILVKSKDLSCRWTAS